MKIEVQITPSKIDDKPTAVGSGVVLSFSPAWNTHGQMVEIAVGGTRYTVSLDQVRRALTACAQSD